MPLRWDAPGEDAHDRQVAELAVCLAWLCRLADVTVVDGSGPGRVAAHRRSWSASARVVEPPVVGGGGPGEVPARNGKVVGALTGVRLARHERVVLADDDVRYDLRSLTAVVDGLEHADLVRPQNVWSAWPWHARWDFARSCLARCLDHDWPGTFALRRSVVLAAGGWADDVLFENLELVRTVRAAGGRVLDLDHVAVPRLPPSTRHFVAQRVRQAYDELARPAWLAGGLLVWPGVALLALRARRLLLVAAAALVALAESGRRRPGTEGVPADVPLWVLPWVLERGSCTWWALLHRARGGMPYRGARLRLAARPKGRSACVARDTRGLTDTDPGSPASDRTTRRTEQQEVVP